MLPRFYEAPHTSYAFMTFKPSIKSIKTAYDISIQYRCFSHKTRNKQYILPSCKIFLDASHQDIRKLVRLEHNLISAICCFVCCLHVHVCEVKISPDLNTKLSQGLEKN